MAKLTLDALKGIVTAYLVASRISQDAPFTPETNALSKMIVKVGDQFQLSSNFEDRLPEILAKPLPLGTTVEEYFMDLVLPIDFDADGDDVDKPNRPTFQDVVYSKQLGRKTFQTTVDFAKYENAMISEEAFASLVASITKKLYDSEALYTYDVKKQLIGMFIGGIPDSRITDSIDSDLGKPKSMMTKLAIPTDTTSATAWIKQVKNMIEELTLLNTEHNNILGVPARAEKSDLILYVKPRLLSVIDVDVLAGAFKSDKVELSVPVKVLEDFGEITNPEDSDFDRSGAWALLVDTRFARLYPIHHSVRSRENEKGEFVNTFLHRQFTAHYSKAVNAHVWSTTFDAEPEEE